MTDKPIAYVADDLATSRLIMRALLEQCGYEVVAAADGEELLKIFSENSGLPDLIVTDISMPGLDGMTVTRLIRDAEAERDELHQHRIPIIAFTAHPTLLDQASAEAVGINAVLEKPVDLQKLSSTINQLTTVVTQSTDIIAVTHAIFEEIVKSGSIGGKSLADRGIITGHLPPAESIHSLLTIENLYQRVGSDTERSLLVLELYRDYYEEVLVSVTEAVAAKNWPKVAQHGHAFKGLLLEVGCRSGADLAFLLEGIERPNAIDKEGVQGVADKMTTQAKVTAMIADEILKTIAA